MAVINAFLALSRWEKWVYNDHYVIANLYFEIYVDWSQIISPSDVIYDLRTFDLLEQVIFNLYLPFEETCPWWTSEINDWRLVRFWLLQPLRWINYSTFIVIKPDLKVRIKFISFACSAYFNEFVQIPQPKLDLNFLFGCGAFKDLIGGLKESVVLLRQ